MATAKTKRQYETVVKEKKQPKELSKIGQWLREHPHGLDGVVINDRRILYGLSPFDPDYNLPQ
jgi:hypothetical protein